MTGKVTRLIPQPSRQEPFRQVEWIFNLVGVPGDALKTYIQFLVDTESSHSDLGPPLLVYLDSYWKPDALQRFTDWLEKQTQWASKTRYQKYKGVRKVMDWAYSLGYIETIVYHENVHKGAPETLERAAFTEDEAAHLETYLSSWLTLAIKVAQDEYQPTGQGLPKRPRAHSVVPGSFDLTQPVELEGVRYDDLRAAAKAYGWKEREPLYRLERGYTLEEAFFLKRRYADRITEAHLWALWQFENDYACDPVAMIQHYKTFTGKKWQEVGVKRLFNLFKMWGVWPYIDLFLIMPLLAELCRLTGLNVESAQSLTIDSYTERHPLTGQPCLSYIKNRSSSATRTATRELHTSLLDTEEHYVEESVQEKVDFLIKLVVKLTSRIRHRAPEAIKRKLFIYEDNDWFKKQREHWVSCPTAKKVEGVDLPAHRGITMWTKWMSNNPELKGIQFNISRFRPSLATKMCLEGIDPFKIQQTLGHSDLAVTMTYMDQLQLKPHFNATVSNAMTAISKTKGIQETKERTIDLSDLDSGYTQTLSGCGCKDAYNPSSKVRALTGHIEGSLCKFWNMCLLCDNSVVTENSLPKLIAYRNELFEAVSSNPNTMKGRKDLYEEIIEKIDQIVEPDSIFPQQVITEASIKANQLDTELLDQLVYQGI
ncbi:MAG: hypothetical protein EVA65_02320 [Oceanococcus sp.]|nr:MAG: hypothetical protein EVA65_02320 [Oceanococcus sp.]